MSSTAIPRCVCIHGHFYQPPRENPWLEVIEEQDSAAPYHDWNARVSAECYAPNARARLMDDRQRITALVNNYAHMSFNIGPTLIGWLETADPDTYEAIRRADRDSARRLGHGNAIAQAFGHAILPLADPRDKVTHVHWGIRDFVHRFGRFPEGMWLPETAVDSATLRVLAEHGIRFTILAPHQASRLHRAGTRSWERLSPDDRIDSRRAYRWRAGKAELALFFYDHELAHGVAFTGLLNDGGAFADSLKARFAAEITTPQLIHLATDGESYGHHHRFGEMALAYAVERIQADSSVRLGNYATFLDLAPPVEDVEIAENTSWSCAHGIERWRADCGCNSGGNPGWRQDWRQPLRDSLNWLKAQLDQVFEQRGAPLLKDPWEARNDYIEVLLDPGRARREAFLAAHARGRPNPADRVTVWRLLEMQRAALLMFTSCGWFFDDLAGIETTQVLRYACRALQLAGHLATHLEADFLAGLEAARANLPGRPSGRQIYRTLVAPAAVSLPRAAAHGVMSSLFSSDGGLPERAHTYRFEPTEQLRQSAGSTALAVGGIRVTCEPTEESTTYAYAALYLGGHDAHCAVGGRDAMQRLPDLRTKLVEVFEREPLSAVVRAIDTGFGSDGFSLRDLFHGERRAILRRIAAEAIRPCLSDLERIFDQHRRMLDFLRDADVPVPVEFRQVARVVLQERLAAALAQLGEGQTPIEPIARYWKDAARWDVKFYLPPLQAEIERSLPRVLSRLAAAPPAHAARAETLLDAADALGVTPNLWPAQNAFYDFATSRANAALRPSEAATLRRLGERLGFATGRAGHLLAQVARSSGS